jgi:O-acetylserine/cysteine efflux transporter
VKPLDGGAALLVVSIWALNFIVGKVGLEQIPPLMMMAIRFALVAVLLLPFLKVQEGRMGRITALSVTLGGLHYSLMFAGLSGIDAGPAAIAVQLFVPFSAVMAWVFFRERLSTGQLIGMAVAFVGVYVLAGEPRIAPRPMYFLMVVGAAFTLALAVNQVKQLGPIRIFTLNAWLAVLATPQLALASLLFEDQHVERLMAADWRGWGAIVFMAVAVTITSHGLWYYLIAKYPVNQVAALSLLVPILAVLLAVLILSEPLSGPTIVGGLLTIGGVAVIERYRRPEKPADRGL